METRVPNRSQTIELPRKPSDLLVVLFSIVSFFFGVIILIIRNQFALDRALIYLAVICFAILLLWSKLWHLSKKWISIIIILGLIGLLASQFIKDDYAGGEWLFHLHRGYPYSWRDGGISVWPAIDKGISVSDYIVQNSEAIQWTVDFPALIVDFLFWTNVSVVIILLFEKIIGFARTLMASFVAP